MPSRRHRFHLIERDPLMDGASIERRPEARDGISAVIKEVAVLRPTSRNRRRYTESARKDAIRVFEGARVMLDHRPTADSETRVRDLGGSLHGLYEASDGTVRAKELRVRGPQATTILNLAESAPDLCGLSIDADGEGTIASDGWLEVEHITRGRSVDVVDRPGSTTNLFESDQNLLEGPIADKLANDAVLEDVRKKNSAAWWLIYQALDDEKASATDRKARVVAILKDLVQELGGDSGTTTESQSRQETSDMDLNTLDIATLEKERPDLAKQLRESADQTEATRKALAEAEAAKSKLKAFEQRQTARALAESVLAEEKLSTDPRFGTAVFIESLVSAAVGLDAEAAKTAIKRVIDDRRVLVVATESVTAPVLPERKPTTGTNAAFTDEKSRDDYYDQVIKESARRGAFV